MPDESTFHLSPKEASREAILTQDSGDQAQVTGSVNGVKQSLVNAVNPVILLNAVTFCPPFRLYKCWQKYLALFAYLEDIGRFSCLIDLHPFLPQASR